MLEGVRLVIDEFMLLDCLVGCPLKGYYIWPRCYKCGKYPLPSYIPSFEIPALSEVCSGGLRVKSFT